MNDGFHPAPLVFSPHGQTVWGRLVRSRTAVRYEREVLVTPDDDDLVIDHVTPENALARILMLHGLEGSSNSVYVQGLAALARGAGLGFSVMNFRSCARDPKNVNLSIPNRRPRMYHSGETSDFDFFAHTMAKRDPSTPLFAIGVSLGGNALLKWLGENPRQTIVSGAVAMSVPFDLAAGATHLEKGLGRFYAASFARTLAAKAKRIAATFPEEAKGVQVAGLSRATTFREIDDYATAPIHGFRDAEDYWARCSSIEFIDKITTPTLCISAKDDPFLPPSVLDRVDEKKSPTVELVVTERGGHIGFVAGSPLRPRYWAEEKAIEWVAEHARQSQEKRDGRD